VQAGFLRQWRAIAFFYETAINPAFLKTSTADLQQPPKTTKNTKNKATSIYAPCSLIMPCNPHKHWL
jgi:hypothetical protein